MMMQSKRVENDTIRLTPIPITVTAAHICKFVKEVLGRYPFWIGLTRKPSTLLKEHEARKQGPTSYGSATIRFHSGGDAHKFNVYLEDKLNCYMFNVRVVIYKYPRGHYHKHILKSALEGTTSWVRITNLSRDLSDEDIHTVIQSRGRVDKRIKGVHLRHHPRYDNYPSVCVVECSSPQCATSLVRNLRMKELKGRPMWVDWEKAPNCVAKDWHSNEAQTPRVRLFGLHRDVDKERLMVLAKQYGGVKSVLHESRHDGYPSGEGVVVMKSQKGARALHHGLHGTVEKDLMIYTYYSTRQVSKFKKKQFGQKPGVPFTFQNRANSRKKAKKKSHLSRMSRDAQKRLKGDNKAFLQKYIKQAQVAREKRQEWKSKAKMNRHEGGAFHSVMHKMNSKKDRQWKTEKQKGVKRA